MKDFKNLDGILDFLSEADKLKWTLRFSSADEIPGDSSAAHSWKLSLMTFIVAEELALDLDITKVLKIAIVHDLAESVTGDIDYVEIADGRVFKEEKEDMERKAMREICGKLPKSMNKEIIALWNEYEKGATREAKFVKALDKLETLSYLADLKHENYDRPEIIATYADKAVESFPELKGILKKIKEKLRKEYAKGNIPWKPEYDSDSL